MIDPARPTVAGNTPRTQPENHLFFPALDGLRAVAFLMIVAQHYMHLPWGWTGVDLFFVLSGFLITGILFDSRDTPHRARNFYLRRTLRIFPLYYGVLLFFFVLTPIMPWHFTWHWIAWPLYLGNYVRFLHPYVPGTPWQWTADAQLGSPQPFLYLGHFWSLCIEEQFYLLWPWVVFAVPTRRRLVAICAACVLLIPIARVIGQHSLPAVLVEADILYRALPFRIDALLLGGLAALLYRGAHRRALIAAAHWVLFACALIAVAYTATHADLHASWRNHVYPAWTYTWGLCFVDVFAAAAIVVALEPGTVLYRELSLPGLRWLGRITYGAYVFHDIYHRPLEAIALFYLGTRHNIYLTDALITAAALAITLPLAALSYRYVETPFLNLKERWTVR